MTTENTNHDDTEKTAVELLQGINSGVIDPKTIDKQGRQQCIELLIAEGYTYPQIVQVLKCSEKTIYRDLKEVRKRNELSPNVEFAKQFIGEMFNKALNHQSYLMRLARTKDASISEKALSESAAWKVLKELIEKLQSLGYLPNKPTEVVGNFYHHSAIDDECTPVEMKKMLLELEEAGKDAGVLDDGVKAKIKILQTRVEQIEIVQDIKQLEDQTLKKQEEQNE
jgi:DNA-binding CsgD family transcriptional regulator